MSTTTTPSMISNLIASAHVAPTETEKPVSTPVDPMEMVKIGMALPFLPTDQGKLLLKYAIMEPRTPEIQEFLTLALDKAKAAQLAAAPRTAKPANPRLIAPAGADYSPTPERDAAIVKAIKACTSTKKNTKTGKEYTNCAGRDLFAYLRSAGLQDHRIKQALDSAVDRRIITHVIINGMSLYFPEAPKANGKALPAADPALKALFA